MRNLTKGGLLTLLLSIISLTKMNAQNSNQLLDAKQQSIVTISAFTANGDLDKLKPALNSGLDAGLSINEIKEELVQLYAYCGFPRSLNALNTFMALLDERKAKGITDKAGKEGTRVTSDDRYEQGRKTLEELTGKPQSRPLTGANAFAPGIDVFLKEHLFADIFGRGVLTYQQRELATIATLATLSGVGAQLQSHINIGINIGFTEKQLRQAFDIISKQVDKAQGTAANTVLTKALAAK